MKKLILCCLLLPWVSHAQRSEIGFSAGTFASIDQIGGRGDDYLGGAHASIYYLYNYKHLQTGAGLEFHYLWGSYVVPELLVNYKFGIKTSYFYSGINTGTTVGRVVNGDTYMTTKFLGVHTGYLYKKTKHLSFNAELGVRRYWQQFPEDVLPNKDAQDLVPIKIGLRYTL